MNNTLTAAYKALALRDDLVARVPLGKGLLRIIFEDIQRSSETCYVLMAGGEAVELNFSEPTEQMLAIAEREVLMSAHKTNQLQDGLARTVHQVGRSASSRLLDEEKRAAGALVIETLFPSGLGFLQFKHADQFHKIRAVWRGAKSPELTSALKLLDIEADFDAVLVLNQRMGELWSRSDSVNYGTTNGGTRGTTTARHELAHQLLRLIGFINVALGSDDPQNRELRLEIMDALAPLFETKRKKSSSSSKPQDETPAIEPVIENPVVEPVIEVPA